ncbi:MAG TPA: DNA repair protein RecN [Bacteroidales bacterium]|jgi:DNA repair protein RecN (Recombination protein N)|nr:DNA repair protein RecN [Bacteroidales bacterium]HBZ20813.1 DNA repair protein RecN [Bacteroidales bacterium]
MLVKLTVHNYALIKELDLSLGNGLTIITGETGAGKSILLGALSLILGSRADSAVLLDKSEKCIVEGTFKIEEYDLEDFFANNDLDFGSHAILRREINTAGKSRAFINDTPVTVNLLKELGERLIDIHSQHQVLMLNDNAFQLNIIDSFAGTSEIRNNYKSLFNDFKKHQKEYVELKDKSDRNKADLEYFKFNLSQLEEAKLRKGEQEELEKEQELLEHAEEIKLALKNVSELFSGDNNSLLAMLREAKTIIDRINPFLPADLNFPSRINSVLIELDDLANEIEKIERDTEADPVRLERINDRLDDLYLLIQKHRLKNLDELILKKAEIENIIKSIETSDDRLTELSELLKTSTVSLTTSGREISVKRRAALPEIESKITDILKQLGMPNARFGISLTGTNDFTSSGIDTADFLFSANKQTNPENIARIASGGELSRVMLSLKSLQTRSKNLPTIIFDEIDSGVSGEVADKVGKILSVMGEYMQVVNITHLPQVASRGTFHYHVYKEETGDSTITRIKLLSPAERIREVARLLSGSEVTETAIKNAKELLKAGKG